MWWLIPADAAAFDSAQVHVGLELSVAIGAKPAPKASRGGPDLGGVGVGLMAGFEAKFHDDDFGPYGGPFLHARLGNGWRGLTVGMVGGYGYTTGDYGHQHLFSMGAEGGVAFVSGQRPALHVGARVSTLVIGSVRVSAHLLHDDAVTHDPTVGIGLVAPLVPTYDQSIIVADESMEGRGTPR